MVRYGDNFNEPDLLDEVTVVMDDDDWKHEIDGTCLDCGAKVEDTKRTYYNRRE